MNCSLILLITIILGNFHARLTVLYELDINVLSNRYQPAHILSIVYNVDVFLIKIIMYYMHFHILAQVHVRLVHVLDKSYR